MPQNTISISELLTDRELACLAKLHKEAPSEQFAHLAASKIIRPVISRIEQNAGRAVDPLYLGYTLQHLFNNRV